MAVSALTQQITDWLQATRPGLVPKPGGVAYAALVSDLQVDDFIVGPRAYVTAAGNSSGNPATRTLTLLRRGELSFSVTWHSASTVWIIR